MVGVALATGANCLAAVLCHQPGTSLPHVTPSSPLIDLARHAAPDHPHRTQAHHGASWREQPARRGCRCTPTSLWAPWTGFRALLQPTLRSLSALGRPAFAQYTRPGSASAPHRSTSHDGRSIASCDPRRPFHPVSTRNASTLADTMRLAHTLDAPLAVPSSRDHDGLCAAKIPPLKFSPSSPAFLSLGKSPE